MVDLEAYGNCTLDGDGCTTCGDTAVPVRVLGFRGNDALVEDRLGQHAEVAVDFISELHKGDIILVHMSVAIARVEAL